MDQEIDNDMRRSLPYPGSLVVPWQWCACLTHRWVCCQVGPDTPYWPVYADRKYDMMRPLPKAKYTARDCAGLNTLPVDA